MFRKTATMGFREQLVAAMTALVVVVSLVIGVLFTLYAFEEEQNRAFVQLDIGERLTREVLERRTTLELSRLLVLTQDFGFRSAIASANPATLASTLENHIGRVGAAFGVILDQQKQPLASTLDQPLGVPSAPLFRQAHERGYARWLVTVSGQGYELILLPVEAPGLRAWMIAAFALNDALANTIARLSDTGVMFRSPEPGVSDYRIFATSAGGEAAKGTLSGAAGANRFLNDPQFFTRVIPLDTAEAEGIQAILLVSRAESMARFQTRATQIVLLLAGILVFAIVIALYIARSLGRPVRQLADYARSVGDGNGAATAPPEVAGSRELAQLSKAFRDMITRLQQREEQIRFAATHDELTELANRNALLEFCQQVFATGSRCSVIGIRLDELSEINDSLGLELGDTVLLGMAERLKSLVPEARILARTGDEEFLLILPDRTTEELDARARDLAEQVRAPLPVDNTPFSLKISVITLALPRDATNRNQFRRRLNLTFEKARAEPDAVIRYQPGEDENHLRQLKLIADLHTAIVNDMLVMHYQPKLDFRTGKLVQVEALVRWIHPELGFVSPEEFIFLAERSGQIQTLTAHILQLVARDAWHWQRQGLEFGVAINLSAMDLAWKGLTDHVRQCFSDLPLGLGSVALEVTESAVMDDPAAALRTLDKLRGLGVSLSVDDFGTGYSSLSQLKQLPVQELKIDKSFVLQLTNQPQDQLIVRSTIDMAHGLGLQVVAEGIEDLDTWKLLQQWHCDLGQGFGLGRPVPAEQLPDTARTLAERLPELAPPT
ncbi:EAL domain-containing protein [Marinobacter sp. VGCF2001]|uniref:bifunctional diguanylate cyclase/phosphodiesterase n=1 Tax=Marinobacter sp. VGCF2001 TaxID=3417189 RepID=UPI003CE9B696